MRVAHISNVTPHPSEKRNKVVGGTGVGDLSVVEDQTYPEVIHQDREEGHHSSHAPWASKLVSTEIQVRLFATDSLRSGDSRLVLVQLFINLHALCADLYDMHGHRAIRRALFKGGRVHSGGRRGGGPVLHARHVGAKNTRPKRTIRRGDRDSLRHTPRRPSP